MYISYVQDGDSVKLRELTSENLQGLCARHFSQLRAKKSSNQKENFISPALLGAAAIGSLAVRLLRRDWRGQAKKKTVVKRTSISTTIDVTVLESKEVLVQTQAFKKFSSQDQDDESDIYCNGKDQTKDLSLTSGFSKDLSVKASVANASQSSECEPQTEGRHEELSKENEELRHKNQKLEAQLNSVISFLFIVDLSKVPNEVLRDYATSLAAGTWKRTAGTNLVVDYQTSHH